MDVEVEVGGWEYECCGDAIERGQVVDLDCMPWLVSPHHDASTRWWMRHVLMVDQHVRVAHDARQPLGLAAVDGAWLTNLYVDRDIGRRRALPRLPPV